ncbi:geranylgeranylglyceryl/heptaprenylglyceryl phosphate synthase, partial [Aurantibacter sp.]|uniref:geranylgeranylglyceryl/heptaprenylglyceryl phosphate synthase n=1 Tax=Aurantibacter sp. TaxID=2807103 RepID=UPI0035C7D3CB
MKQILKHIEKAITDKNKLLAVLIDPDKFILSELDVFLKNIHKTIATHIFIGGSTVEANVTQQLVKALKQKTDLPLVLFPGDVTQISDAADAILFLSLLSGRNSDYLIGKHVKSVPLLEKTDLEIISAGYILIESGKETAVQRVTKTLPLSDKKIISQTAKAGEFLGMKLIYLEAGSGANYPVALDIITETKKRLQIPLIVGGGIRSLQQLENAYIAGADLVVIGTAFEENKQFFKELL